MINSPALSTGMKQLRQPAPRSARCS